MTHDDIDNFRQVVWDYYGEHGRDLPWRIVSQDERLFAYHVLVSEFMLQQTQVSRVVPKYKVWLERFPSLESVASASLAELLTYWNGLGYNRRARYIQNACKVIRADHSGLVPKEVSDLQKLPGIGRNTAAAIATYAYNQPEVFIETNVRTVFIYHFFPHQEGVADTDLLPLIEQSLDKDDPRQWYWALMDYGSYLKKEHGNVAVRSKHHVKQSSFAGSKRQIRGRVITYLITGEKTPKELAKLCADTRLREVLDELVREKLIIKTEVGYRLPTA